MSTSLDNGSTDLENAEITLVSHSQCKKASKLVLEYKLGSGQDPLPFTDSPVNDARNSSMLKWFIDPVRSHVLERTESRK